jgi:hypothetical protein
MHRHGPEDLFWKERWKLHLFINSLCWQHPSPLNPRICISNKFPAGAEATGLVSSGAFAYHSTDHCTFLLSGWPREPHQTHAAASCLGKDSSLPMVPLTETWDSIKVTSPLPETELTLSLGQRMWKGSERGQILVKVFLTSLQAENKTFQLAGHLSETISFDYLILANT